MLLAVSIVSFPSSAMPPPERTAVLRRGINITGWFRYNTSRDPAALHDWMSDPAMTDLKRAGFTFVRLAADPAMIDGPVMRQVFLEQVRRLQRHGLAVIVSPHPVSWSLDTNPSDRVRFAAFWQDLAPMLRGLPAALTFPEVVNEPVFHDDLPAWNSLQNNLHETIRDALPNATIILTGQDWGGIVGLLALLPDADAARADRATRVGVFGDGTNPSTAEPDDANADPNVVYSFHFYDPPELTSLAAYRPGLDRDALARLPFPQSGMESCRPAADSARDAATRDLIRFYCTTGWDAARVRLRLQDAVAWARRHGVALLAGEFGASAALNPSARLAWLRLVRETCDANGIGWSLWGYDDIMGLAVRRPLENRPALDRSVLGALGLPVP